MRLDNRDCRLRAMYGGVLNDMQNGGDVVEVTPGSQ